MSDIKNMLTKIFDKLDGKQDKRWLKWIKN
jgi:hypothetical protein